MSEADSLDIEALVAARVAEAVAAQLQPAVEEAVTEAVRRTTAAMEEQITLERRKLLDPTQVEGAVLNTDPGQGYVFGLIPVAKTRQNPLSNRTPEELSPDNPEMQALIASIKAAGLLARPLLVYRKDDGYVLVKGARRLAAVQALGEELVQAYILPAKPPMGMEEQWVNGF